MLPAILLFTVGLALSAFFSGSETGFYRVTRVRLLIDALGGDWVAKGLLWATNNPALFVATALVGNNVANYLVSYATVFAAGKLFPDYGAAEIVLTLAMTPIVFIYGELLPKNLFFAAPNRLLRRCAPALSVAGVLFSPISAVMGLVGILLQRLSKSPAQVIRMVLARRELSGVLDEGHAVGLLAPAQRQLAQGTFSAAGKSIREFMIPAARLPQALSTLSREELLTFARRRRQAFVILRGGGGYVRAADCLLHPGEALPVRDLIDTPVTANFLPALLRMQEANRAVAAVRDGREKIIGYVFAEQLRKALMAEQGL